MIEMSSDCMKVPSITETAISHLRAERFALSVDPGADATGALSAMEISLMERRKRHTGRKHRSCRGTSLAAQSVQVVPSSQIASYFLMPACCFAELAPWDKQDQTAFGRRSRAE